ncbi:hypothetical protein D1P53_003278 [Cryptococcus gattii VGV]|nr:hypothetical protein D1P53_003278 [Cryptococcus gattii VGV]
MTASISSPRLEEPAPTLRLSSHGKQHLGDSPDDPSLVVVKQRRLPSLATIGVHKPMAKSSNDPTTQLRAICNQHQTTALDRKLSQAFVPAWSNKANYPAPTYDKEGRRVSDGVKNRVEEDLISEVFYDTRLTIDEPGDEDAQEGLSRTEDGLEKEKRKYFGWNEAPICELSEADRRDRKKYRNKNCGNDLTVGHRPRDRHRSKRAMREFDKDLDAFNKYAQNCLVPLTGSRYVDGLRPCNVSTGSGMKGLNILDSIHLRILNPSSDDRLTVPVGDGFDALDVMGDHIFRIGTQKKKWFKTPTMGNSNVATGVSIRAKTGLYRSFPVHLDRLQPFEDAMAQLNPEVGVKIQSDIVRCIMTAYVLPSPSMSELVINEDTRIQIVDSIELLARARKHQYAAFVRSERVLCVWADDVEMIIPAAELLEELLIRFIWRGEEENAKFNQAMVIDAKHLTEQMSQCSKQEGQPNPRLRQVSYGNEANMMSLKDEPTKATGMDLEDVEASTLRKYWRERPVMLVAPLSDALSIVLVMALIALGLRTLIKEYTLDGKTKRFTLVIFAPALFCIASYACILTPIVGSVSNPPKRTMEVLPHVTVQLPVYKESLEDVIMPTIKSLKKAITTYERQGGSVGVLVCDDGLQLLPRSEVDKRQKFYFDNNIAFVARPGHGSDGFIRKGRFKKAGNMNYAAALSLRVEEIMDELRDPAYVVAASSRSWTESYENSLYEQALSQALDETGGRAWAEGNIRFGEIILIVDSDTRVPEDCFADAVSEMKESPEVAIIQHMSGVMQIANHFFENGVAHFTRGIQHAISYCCASGEVAPFVGHNAFLRWSALQECMFVDPDDNIRKIWSEDHVSEDFQIAVTLQIKGYIVRWATYSGGEFEEGVSLTCDDELNRWQKYAFGCS